MHRTETLAQQVEAAIQRLVADPADAPSNAELARAAVVPDIAESLTIGEVAELTGVGAHTLRYYEREGLLRVERAGGGRRRYDRGAVERIVLVSRLRVSGMSIATLKRLTGLFDRRGVADPDVQALLSEHRAALARRIAELRLALAITDYKLATGRLLPTG